MASVVVSLSFEFILTVHIVVGLIFVALVICHLVQRRKISSTLARRLTRFTTSQGRLGRMAVSDALLALLNGVIREIPGVRDTETFMYLKLAKQTYTWGTR